MINNGDIDLCGALSAMSDEELHECGNCGGVRSCSFCQEEADQRGDDDDRD